MKSALEWDRLMSDMRDRGRYEFIQAIQRDALESMREQAAVHLQERVEDPFLASELAEAIRALKPEG